MRAKTNIAALVLWATVCACIAQPGGKPEQVITKLKALHRETSLVTAGKANALIVIPEGDEYRALGLQVKDAIATATGATLQVKTGAEMGDGHFGQHVILLGNMDNNPFAEELYWEKYIACDLDYPGPGGYVVRTACDPWGTGKNVIVLGGSDAEGVQRAVSAFLPRVTESKDLVLPLLLDIKLNGVETITAEKLQTEWDYYKTKYLEAKGLWYGCEKPVHRLAYDYYLTGVEEYAKIYNEVIKSWMAEYYRFTLERQLVTPKYDMPDMFLAWNLVEESPAISDDVRLEFTNLFYDYAIRMGEGPRVRDWQPGRMRLTGHVPLLSVVYGHAYFTKYYPGTPNLERLEKGMENVRIAMASYSETDGFMSETGYLGMHPRLLAYYAQYAPDYTWFMNEKALRWEQYHTLVTDNAGTAMGGWSPTHLMAARYYDDGRWLWLSNFQRHGSDYGTKVVNGKLNRNRWLGRPAITPVPPSDITGLRVFHMGEAWYKELVTVREEMSVPQEKAFNQAVMRVDFERSSQYARIPGVNIGFHYGTPANAFIRLYDKGRNWLVNGRWGMSLMKYYNTMLVIRNGQASPSVPYLCSLETEVDLHRTGFLQSRMPDYNGTDWMRSVVWNKQRYWLVFDAVRPQTAGDYTCLCQWRAGPRPSVQAGRAVFGKAKPALVVEAVGSPTISVRGEGPAHGTIGSHMLRLGRSGKMAAGDEAPFCSLLWVKGGAAVISGWRRWQSSPDTALLDFENPHAGKAALKLVNVGNSWQCLRQKLPETKPGAKYLMTGWVRANAKVSGRIEIRDPGIKAVMLATGVSAAEDWTKIEFEFVGVPQGHTCELWLSHDTYKALGGVAWFDDLRVVKADEPDENLVANADFEKAVPGRRLTSEYSVRGLAENCAIVTEGKQYWLAGAAGDAQRKPFAPVEGVRVAAKAFNISPTCFGLAEGTALAWGGQLFGSEKPVDIEVNMATGEGVVQCVEDSVIGIASPDASVMLDGKRVKAEKARAMVRFGVAAGRHTFQLTPCGAGQRAADAKRIWDAARKPGRGEAAKPSGREMKTVWQWQGETGDAFVKAVRSADLDGDGKPETIAGLTDGTTVVIGSDGREVSRHKADKAINDVECLDLDGDGELEVLSACDDCKLYATDLAGQEVWTFSSEGRKITNKLAGELGPGRHVSSEGEFITLKIADLDGDGKQEILAGAKCFQHGRRHVYGTLWVLSLQGKQLWHVFNFGGTVDTIDCLDLDGDGKLETVMGTGGGTYGRSCYTVNQEGQFIARYSAGYGEKRAAFARLRKDGPIALVRLESTNGTVWVNDADKGAAAWWTYPSSGLSSSGPAVADFDADGMDEVLIAGESGDVYMLSDAPDGHLIWRRNLGAPVTCLQVATLGGAKRIVAGMRGGLLVVLGAAGETQAYARLGADIRSMDAGADGKQLVVGLQDGRAIAITF